MKRLTVILVSLLVSLPNYAALGQNKKTDVENDGLKGKVKSKRYNYYDAEKKDNKIIKGRDKGEGYLYEYDEKGNKIKNTDIDTNGLLYSPTYYKHDEKGHLIEELSPSDSLHDGKRIIYNYNEKGYINEEYEYIGDSLKTLKQKVSYKYDDKGNLIERRTSGNKSLLSKNIFKYDKANNLIEEDCYNWDSTIWSKHILFNDFDGRKIQCDVYKGDGNLESRVTYKYNDKGKEIEWACYHKDGTLDRKDITIYDDKGVLQGQEWYDKRGLYRKYTYEFDKHGNWIKKIANENGKYTISIREIKYY
jgi:YD repeat-containing protein